MTRANCLPAAIYPSPEVIATGHHAANGVNDNVSDVMFNVSPLLTVFDAANDPDHRKFPALEASQILMWEIVSVPAAHDAQVRVPLMAFDPAAAADQVTAARVVFADAAVAPAEPGSAVCSFTYTVAGAVNAVPPIMSSHLLARFAVFSPVAIYSSSSFCAGTTSASATIDNLISSIGSSSILKSRRPTGRRYVRPRL